MSSGLILVTNLYQVLYFMAVLDEEKDKTVIKQALCQLYTVYQLERADLGVGWVKRQVQDDTILRFSGL